MSSSLLARLRPILVAGVCLAIPAASPSGAERRPITETDLFSFVWVADPQIAPDGSRVAFLRVSVDRQKDQYETAIWIADSDGREPPRRLTAGPRDTAPRWSPDGTRLAFVRAAESDGRVQPPQIFVMPMNGGEGRAVTDIPAAPETRPGRLTDAPSPSRRPHVRRSSLPTRAQEGSEQRESDVRVITEARYRANGVPGSGYVDSDRPSHIWTVALGDPASKPAVPKRLTSESSARQIQQWSPDGREIFFTADRRKESYYPGDSDLYAVPVDGGEPRRAASIDGNIGAFAWSGDGKRIAFIGSANAQPERSCDQSDLFVVETTVERRAILTASSTSTSAARSAAISAPADSFRRRRSGARMATAFFQVGEQGNSVLASVDVAAGKVDRKTAAQDLMSYTADAKAARFAMVVSADGAWRSLRPEPAGGAPPKKLTSFNDALFGDLNMNEPEEIWYSSFDGRKIQGWILKPPGFDPQKKLPAHPADSRRSPFRLRQHVRTSSSGWPPRATSSCTRTRAAARTTARISGTSSSSTIPATTTRI